MDNYGNPYPYNHTYGYQQPHPAYGSASSSDSAYPPPNSAYPPPNSAYPPPNFAYPQPNPVPYPQPNPSSYPSSPSYQYPYTNPPYAAYPPRHRTSYSTPNINVDYLHSTPPHYSPYPPYPAPALDRHNSFQHHYEQIPPPVAYSSDDDTSTSLPTGSSLHHDESDDSSPPSVHPPLDIVVSNMHVSDNEPKPTTPASAPASLAASTAKYDTPPEGITTPTPPSAVSVSNFYGYPNAQLSSNWEPTYPVYRASLSLSGPVEGRPGPNYPLNSSISLNESRRGCLQIVPHKASLKLLLIHGNLDIWINEAKRLPNMDLFHKTIGDVFSRFPANMCSNYNNHMNGKKSRITSDPYVSISLSNAVIGRTYVISNNENPVWMQHFNVPVAHHASEVQFLVKDSDVVGSQLIGVVSIPVEQIYGGNKVEGTFPLYNSSGKPCKPGATLSLSIQYFPMHELKFYQHGVGAGPNYFGVPGTYFPLRKGGHVTLYQDAHVPDGFLPNLNLDRGMYYVNGKCWHDIFDAIRQARRLIYITGWSVLHKVRLIRDGGYSSNCTLGELLRSKSAEGVRVLLLIWDDPTSRNILGYKTDGIMATHDEETRRFFKHSSVQVLLCARNAGKRHSWMKQKEVGTIYTHHQKTVIVDGDAGGNRRKIVAFVGGLDICDGRYDTPEHPLFRTLKTVHYDDYHNPTFTVRSKEVIVSLCSVRVGDIWSPLGLDLIDIPKCFKASKADNSLFLDQGSVSGCPREPWHDLHSKIDGPAAYDVLTNFEERWLKASKPSGIKKLKKSYDDALLRLERIPDIVGVNDAPSAGDNDPESWHVQIFRSIDSNSVKGFPKDPKNATSKNLMCGKNLLIDMSIHTAYVKAIRSAQHFIYIENQYFIGSSYNWSSYKELGANNLIPMEIALKIADKIRANERFAAYIVIPMWPEGVPTGAATQRILFWQHKTMQMMYETIYKALVEVGLEDAFTPQDYLNFFCLGNREAYDAVDNTFSSGSPNAVTPQAMCKKSRRFMIYVHSKGMIVDDEYVILGSANINQRSMEGTRDTEIAMGAYQPQYTWAKKQSSPHGQIYGYRMSLWAEHTGTIEECFTYPESLECVKRVKLMGEVNWKQFASEEVTEMRGHLLKYPVDVDRRGKVKPLSGFETFPDVGGNICGSFLAIQENLTI